MKEKGFVHMPQNKKLFKIDFNNSPQSIYSQSSIKVISNLKLERSRTKKVSSNKIDLRMFVEGSFYVSCTLNTHLDVIGQHLV